MQVQTQKLKPSIHLKLEIFQEGDLYVGICPALNVSSFGETVVEAKRSTQEALEAFVEACEELGTLAEVLEESGFRFQNGEWLYPEVIKSEC